ncbi:MAG: ATP-dependent sacrificial sulfur transferase LarE [candidate division WOR-3 bacterium]|nr:MAG: ATP-dependent sacrificial sulfur transferase LarE [candidate division WOR-3 bacterium]
MPVNDFKLERLKRIIQNYQRVILAYSGGVDSTFLLKICVDVLGQQNVIAVTAISDSYTKSERMYAESISKTLDVTHLFLKTNEMSDDDFVSNMANRCYFCKKHLFSELKNIAKAQNIQCLLDASNVDDESDYRPGRKAAREFFVKSPLIEAGMTKEDIRKYSRMLGLDSWKKPANPCLASRIPYGSKITKEKLEMVEKAEAFLKNEGFTIVRVRHHGEIARIEVSERDIKKLAGKDIRTKIIKYFKDLGFIWIAVDLEGYRTGSLNEILK